MKEKIETYLADVFGENFRLQPFPDSLVTSMPLYLRSAFELSSMRFFNQDLVLTFAKDKTSPASHLANELKMIRKVVNKTIVLVLEDIDTQKRRGLIKLRVDFIVPGKQLFLPSLLMDLKESTNKKRLRNEKLTPTAQMLLIYRLLSHYKDVNGYGLKQWAETLQLTPEAISKGAENLQGLELCTIKGMKEKFIHFDLSNHELWQMAKPYTFNPVVRRFFKDELPEGIPSMPAGESALPEYSDMAPSRQAYRAIEKRVYDAWKKNAYQWEENNYEGRYYIELWRYNPLPLAEEFNKETIVDPLSLYLSLKEVHDERIEMALDQIIKKYIW